jgi:hypothetical protein
MSVGLKEVFDEHFSKVKFDSKLAKELYQYQIGYINRNHEHLEFFGSNLLGVHVVRFKDSDLLRFYEDIFDIDYYTLVEDVRKVTTINHDFKVAGDVFNLTCMYVLHKVISSPLLDTGKKERAAYDIALIFFYRCIAALLSYYFKYPADPKVAQAAYAKLSNKFLIKKLGSWHKVMDYRALDLIGKNNLHYKNLLTFRDDVATVYAISDSQGRVRDLVKNYYAEFNKVHVDGESIGSNSSTYLDADGEETTVEKTKSVEGYVTSVRASIIDKHSFIKEDIVELISKMNNNSSKRIIRHTLTWLVDNYNDGKLHKTIDEFMSLVVIHSMFIIESNIEASRRKDYAHVLITLKNIYLSTRSIDNELTKIRELGEVIVKQSNGKVNNSLMLSTRTSVILYISLFAISSKNR